MASFEVTVKCASNLWILLLLAPAMYPLVGLITFPLQDGMHCSVRTPIRQNTEVFLPKCFVSGLSALSRG